MEDNIDASKEIVSMTAQSLIMAQTETGVASQITPFFIKGEALLLKEIKQFNNVENLLLQGEYRKSRDNYYGFFVNISHTTGKEVYYPVLKSTIESIFVPPNNLTEGGIYTFEVRIANIKERNKQQNPFLLQTKIESIEESIRLSEIQFKIIEEAKALSEIEKEAKSIIEQYNNKIDIKSNEIGEKNNLIADLNNQISEIEIQLLACSNKKSEMEATINFLRQKIDICKNLEFISKQDVDKYLDVLGTTHFVAGDKYLDFEKDLSSNFSKLVTHIQIYLYRKKNLIYTEFQIKNFMSLLITNDLIVLSGLSGSGKTQIVKSFAEVLGGVAKIIPVKPNWTSSDDLLGYYNPIQSSFLPTPFTEAIAEATQNPHRIYLICLDEMNLARAEYYFADFLSKMEERSEQPEIELYARHEEELFISEFKTLLTLMESATGGKMVSSWQAFLETDSIRNRFFELLGNTEKETLLQIHSKMRRRLLDILKFPSTMKIPSNVRFIGTINIDETTHYFSPKILDRVHVVKFENPLLFEEKVSMRIEKSNYETELKPVYLNPMSLGKREEYPAVSDYNYSGALEFLKNVNKNYLLPLNIDFGIRSIRQTFNYMGAFSKITDYPDSYSDIQGDDEEYMENLSPEMQSYIDERTASVYEGVYESVFNLSLNAIVVQKILPRFVFDGNESVKNGGTKIQILEEFTIFLKSRLHYFKDSEDFLYTGYISYQYLEDMIKNAELNNNQVNFHA